MKSARFKTRGPLTGILWSFWPTFLLVGCLSFLTNLLMLAPTIYMLQIFDRVLASQSELTLLAVSLITLFLFGVIALSERLRSRVLIRAGIRFDKQVGSRVFQGSFKACLSQATPAMSRPHADLMQIRQFLTGSGIFALFDAPWVPIYLAVIFFLHPVLGYLALVFALVQATLGWLGHRQTAAPSERALNASRDTASQVQSRLHNAEALASMGMTGNIREAWNRRHADWMEKEATAQKHAHRVAAWSKFVRYSQQSLGLGAGALLVIHGEISPGSMIAANVLMTRALAPVDQLISTWRVFSSCRAAFGRLQELLSQFPEESPAPSRAAPTGAISLHDVVAGVFGRAAPVLKNISFAAPAGTMTAIIGPSGSGKSTLARVMVGVWPELTGDVTLDGVPMQAWNRAELGRHIGYLPQDVELFEGTIAENIARMGEIDSAKVIEAARGVGMHETILRFPKGYDTLIGEAGSLLSGGQRQRIGLARAMYGEPPLIVLDEPNANLDDAGEAALARTVRALKAQGKTVFLISHRQGILSLADRVMALKDGEIIAYGPREDVLAGMRHNQPLPSQGLAVPAS